EAAEATAEAMLPMVKGAWEGLRRRAKSVQSSHPSPTDENLHRVRIHAKRLRYAAETVAPVIGKPARAFARRTQRLQSVLGEYNDAVVAAAWLRDWAADAADPAAAFAAGELAGLELETARAGREAWRKPYERLGAKSLRRWMDRPL
ncbi:MAG: CHAD domain-containing protein, partial [Actinomycetota bacterium]